MLIIGQANQYFTFWDVSAPYKEYTSATSFYYKVDHRYLQNLAFNFEQAKAKAEILSHGQPWEVSLELRGTRSYSERLHNQLHNEAPATQFAFGKCEGQDILTCSDIWQLNRLIEEQDSPVYLIKRRAAYARRRLIDLDLLVKYDNYDQKWLYDDEQETGEYIKIKRSYTTPKNAALLEAKKLRDQTFDHYFNNGERVVLKLKEVEIFGFETQYGICYIATYLDIEGRGFKYMGSSPPSFISQEDFTPVKGTVAHDEYKGIKETKLKRMALAS